MSLAFVGFIAGVITIAADNERVRITESQARAAAIHFVTTARAARIFVRDNSGTVAGDVNQDGVADNIYDPNLAGGIAGAAPVQINPAQLIAAGLLPQNYSPVNAYGQTIQIFAETFPLNTPGAAPTAFVFLGPSPRATAADMQLVSQAAFEFDAAFDAPLFDNTGANVSAACNGTPSVVRWGSAAGDCLNAGDMAAFGVAFAQGALVAPVWQVALHDSRAVMRFAQPNNPGSNVMATDLFFGQIDTGAVTGGPVATYVPNPTGAFIAGDGRTYDETFTALVNVLPDDANNLPAIPANATQAQIMASDLRTDIIGVNQIDVRQMVLSAQTPVVNEVRYNAGGAISANDVNASGGPENEVLDIGGNLNVDGSVTVSGRLGNPTANRALNTAGALQIDHSLTVFRDGAGPALDIDITGTSTVDSAQAANMNVGGNTNLNGPASFTGTNSGTLGTANVAAGAGGDPGVVFANINANNPGGTITTNNLDVISIFDTTGANVNIQGDAGSGYAMVSEQMSVGTALTVNNLSVQNGMIVDGNAGLNGTTTFQDCASSLGRCPDIQELPRPCQIDGTC